MTGVADQSLPDETIAGEATTDPLVPVFIEQRERLATVTAERDEWKQRAEDRREQADRTEANLRRQVDQLQEQLEQARLHAAHVTRAWGYVSGGEPDEAVDAFDSAITNMSEFFASRSGYPTTTETPRVERLAEQLDKALEILEGLFKAAQIDGRYDWTAVERFLRSFSTEPNK